MKLLEQIEYWHNRASDTNFVWFPFVFLRPEPSSSIDFSRKLKMIICFGCYYGFFAGVRSAFFKDSKIIPEIVKDIVWGLLIFGIWFSAVTAPLWNLRSKRLNEKH